jgi:hypothetical protein
MMSRNGTSLHFQSPKFKGLLCRETLVEQGFDNWNQTGYLFHTDRGTIIFQIDRTNRIYGPVRSILYMNCQVCIAALIEETNVFTSLNCSDVILVGSDWTRLIDMEWKQPRHGGHIDHVLQDRRWSTNIVWTKHSWIYAVITEVLFVDGLPRHQIDIMGFGITSIWSHGVAKDSMSQRLLFFSVDTARSTPFSE